MGPLVPLFCTSVCICPCYISKSSVNCLYSNSSLPPTTKLGQGNIFRSVCQEFCSHLGAVHAGRYGQQVGGMHPTGMHTCLVCVFFVKITQN